MSSTPHLNPSRPRSGARFSGYAPIARIFRIHVLINQGERVTQRRIAEEFEVALRTIRRDLDFMRNSLGIKIRFHPKWGSYYYVRPCPVLPLFRLTAQDLATLALVNHTFSRWAGLSVGALLRTVFRKFQAVAGVALPSGQAADHDDVTPLTDFARREQEHIVPVWEAMERRRELTIVYRKRGAAAAETRTIHPLHVDCPGGRWIVIARDLLRNDLRTFRLGRVHAVQATGKRFRVRPDFNPAELVRGNLGAYTGREEHEVRILLRDTAATFAEEEGLHPRQKLEFLPDGRVLVTLRLNNLVEIKNEILRWGPEAEVLSPPQLREAVHEAHQTALAQYEKG